MHITSVWHVSMKWTRRDFHPLWCFFPENFWSKNEDSYVQPNTTSPICFHIGFSLPCAAFARCYSRHLFWFLFLQVLRCFNSLGCLHTPIYSAHDSPSSTDWVIPFGYLRIIGCSPPPRSVSPVATSFIVVWCQGIHHPPLCLDTGVDQHWGVSYFSVSDFQKLFSLAEIIFWSRNSSRYICNCNLDAL